MINTSKEPATPASSSAMEQDAAAPQSSIFSENTTNQSRSKPLAQEPVRSLILRFALPATAAMLVNALYNITDQAFIGWSVGYLGNAATSVSLLLTLAALSLALLAGDGAAAWFSLRLGEGKVESAAQGPGNAAIMVGIASFAALAIASAFLEPLLRLFGASATLLPHAKEYASIIILGFPLIMTSTALNACIRADGSPRYAMMAMMSGAVLNLLLDPLFLFGFGWGVQGAAWATVAGQGLSLGLTFAYLRRFRSVRLEKRHFQPRLSVMRAICALGFSSFVDQLAFTLVMGVNNNLIAQYGAQSPYGGDISLTAYGIAMKMQEVLFTVVLGIAIGMQPVAGFNYGAKRFDRVRQAYIWALIFATAASVLGLLVFMLFPSALAVLFGLGGNALYVEFSRKFFQTYFLLYAVFGFQIVTGVFFQATGKPARAAVLALSYQVLFKITAALGLTSFMGLDGVLWSGPLADALAFCLGVALLIPVYPKKEGSTGYTSVQGCLK